MKSLYNNDIRSTNKVTNLLFFAVFLSQLFLLSCHSRKKVDDFKPMKPTGNQYCAHDAGGHWALEMDIYGDFSFYDFTNSFEIQTKTPDYIGKKEGVKQKLEWNMISGKESEQKVRFTILQENCFNFGFANNPFILEVFHDGAIIYQMSGCGTFHDQMFQEGSYTLMTVNDKGAQEYYKLTEPVVLKLEKTKTSNLINGRLACRYWQGAMRLLDKTMSINFNIHPTSDCKEGPELTKCMEDMGNSNYVFDFTKDPKKGTQLTLSDKNHTFVFVKKD